MFWMLNTIGWVTFYWHWKHMTIWGGNPGQFDESSNYIMGWLRDYLWLNSSPLINGYNPFGMNNLSVWSWMFLFGHLIWATGFMFLLFRSNPRNADVDVIVFFFTYEVFVFHSIAFHRL